MPPVLRSVSCTHTAFDLGCAFTLHVEPSGYGVAQVTSGWIQFREGDLESLVPAGAEAVTRPGLGPGTAYFSDAAPMLDARLPVGENHGLETRHPRPALSRRHRD